MIFNESTPNRVFKIGELARLIASQLILLNPKSAVDLARTCRYLEEPTLSTLWETQDRLDTLLKVLPKNAWVFEYQASGMTVFRTVGDPSPEAWKRVQRYASWMRRVSVYEWWSVGEDTLHKFRLYSPADGWFPALQDLFWCITKSNALYLDLFFSPGLKKVSIYALWSETPHEILPVITSTISALPVSALQYLFFSVHPWGYFKDSFSSVVLRCGPPLTALPSPTPLSDAAIDHLIHLPNLHTWTIKGPPPIYSASPLPLVFPPLEELTLEGSSAREWFSLFERLEDHILAVQGVTPLSRMKQLLTSLDIKECPNSIIDARLASPIQMFHNLVFLNVEASCHDTNNDDPCVFKLNDDDVTKLTIALPQLQSLLLGVTCPENTCATTIACLLQISVHCVGLRALEIHFNTTDIVGDLKKISEDPEFQELRSLPRCSIARLDVFFTPLDLDEHGFKAVISGMADIFPSLVRCEGSEPAWIELSEGLVKLQRT